MKSSQTLRPHQTAILAAAVASVVFYAVPGIQWAMLPLKYLNTHVHEICHALATQGTGGHVDHIEVFANGSGVTPVYGGSTLILASAGYLGAALVGMLLVMGSRSEAASRTVLRAMAVVMAISMALWLRGDGVGFVSGILWVLGLLGIAQYARGMTLMFLAQFIGIQQCLNSVDSVYTLLKISVSTDMHSDAQILQQTTGLPAVFWASMWCLISVTLLTLGLRKAWSTSPRPAPTSRVG